MLDITGLRTSHIRNWESWYVGYYRCENNCSIYTTERVGMLDITGLRTSHIRNRESRYVGYYRCEN